MRHLKSPIISVQKLGKIELLLTFDREMNFSPVIYHDKKLQTSTF